MLTWTTRGPPEGQSLQAPPPQHVAGFRGLPGTQLVGDEVSEVGGRDLRGGNPSRAARSSEPPREDRNPETHLKSFGFQMSIGNSTVKLKNLKF